MINKFFCEVIEFAQVYFDRKIGSVLKGFLSNSEYSYKDDCY
jgi:hypothetical protein